MSGATSDRPVVTAYARPYASTYELYQTYYREGIRRYCAAGQAVFRTRSMTQHTPLLRQLRHVRDRLPRGRPGVEAIVSTLDRTARPLEGSLMAPSSAFHSLVGQYLFESEDGLRRVCIDSADYPAFPSRELVDWSDVYFKTNYWPARQNPPHARPLVNGDPSVLPELAQLRAYRRRRKDIDVCFVTRVWGGQDEVEGIEHCLRLLEAVSKANCSKEIVAVLLAGDTDAQRRRLSRFGITCTTNLVPRKRLWELSARARLNVIRLGMHACIPWRVTGAQAIGSCVVLDQSPPSQWPQPLLENRHFLNLAVDTVAAGSPVASQADYDEVPGRIEAWLTEPERLEAIGGATAAYFDECVEPGAVGAHIFREVAATA